MSASRYVSNQPVRDRVHLHGREAELARLQAWLGSGGLYALYGGERMGKTSLLYVLQTELASNLAGGLPRPPLVLSLLPQPRAYTAQKLMIFYQALVDDLRAEVGEQLDVCTIDDELAEKRRAYRNDPYRFFERSFQVLYQASQEVLRARLMGQKVDAFSQETQADLRIAFLLDDAHFLLGNSWGQDFLKHLHGFYSANSPLRDVLVILMAGTSELEAILDQADSPVAGLLSPPALLQSLDRTATEQIVNEPLGESALNAEVIDIIQDLTGGHPYLVKFLMQQIDMALSEDLAELLALTPDDVAGSGDEIDITEGRQAFRLWNRGLDDIGRLAFHHLLAARPPAKADWPGLSRKALQEGLAATLGETVDLSPRLNALGYYGLVRSEGRLKKTYRPQAQLFIKWFEEHVPLPRPVIEDEAQHLSFRLRILDSEGEDGPYPIEVESPAGYLVRRDGSFFHPPLSTEEFEAVMNQMRLRDRAVDRHFLRDLGGKLHKALFQGKVKSLYDQCLGLARDEPGVVLRLWMDSPQLLGWPWEILYDEEVEDFLVLSERRPLVRFLPLMGTVPPLEVELPLRILLASASPADLPPLAVEREVARIQEELSPYRDQLQLTVLHHCTRDNLSRALQQGVHHIFHFIGHGALRENGEGFIFLEDEKGHAFPLSGSQLGSDLRPTDVRLAILNACETGSVGMDNPMRGLAPSLVVKGVPAVVAMQLRVADDSAATFAAGFYLALVGHPLVDQALATARRLLPGAERGHAIDWLAPTLFLRAEGSRILRYRLAREPGSE